MTGDRLEEMVTAQRALQSRLGYDFAAMSDRQRVAYVKEMYVALVKELGEMLDECQWKPWASASHKIMSELAFFGELIDALHFMLNLFLVARPGLDPAGLAREIAIGFLSKNETNLRRQDDGYDGVTGKCQCCHRALDDAGVSCTAPVPAQPEWGFSPGKLVGHCADGGTYLVNAPDMIGP